MTGLEQTMNDGETFFEPAHPMIEWISVGNVLRFVPPRAESENQTAITNFVDGFRDLGKHGGIAKTHAADKWPDLDTIGRGRKSSQNRPAFPAALSRGVLQSKEHVIGDPNGIKPDLFRQFCHLKNVAPPVITPADYPGAVRNVETDLERPD
jgi:hypothetical protein